jgi:hypothetical protein
MPNSLEIMRKIGKRNKGGHSKSWCNANNPDTKKMKINKKLAGRTKGNKIHLGGKKLENLPPQSLITLGLDLPRDKFGYITQKSLNAGTVKNSFLTIYNETMNLSFAANSAGASSGTILKWLQSDEDFAERFKECRMAMLDKLECNLYKMALADKPNIELTKYILEHLAKDRGWAVEKSSGVEATIKLEIVRNIVTRDSIAQARQSAEVTVNG